LKRKRNLQNRDDKRDSEGFLLSKAWFFGWYGWSDSLRVYHSQGIFT
jgi:hypothetical protein